MKGKVCNCPYKGCSHYGAGICRLTGEKCPYKPGKQCYHCCSIEKQLGASFQQARKEGQIWNSFLRRGES